MVKRIFVLILIILLVSCEKSDEFTEALGSNIDIIGTWIESDLDAAYVEPHLMQRAEKLAPDRYGFIIRSDGTFTERKNAGWCGAPPIAYDNFDGEWVAISDSLLEITVGYWGGIMTYEMKIISLEGDVLELQYFYNSE